jgi:hypothetical protein
MRFAALGARLRAFSKEIIPSWFLMLSGQPGFILDCLVEMENTNSQSTHRSKIKNGARDHGDRCDSVPALLSRYDSKPETVGQYQKMYRQGLVERKSHSTGNVAGYSFSFEGTIISVLLD